MESFRPNRYFKSLSLKEKAALYASLLREPGWELLKHTFQPNLKTRVTDSDSREALLYEAIRAQVIQEIFSTPGQVIYQVDREYDTRRAPALNEPMPPIDAEEDTPVGDTLAPEA